MPFSISGPDQDLLSRKFRVEDPKALNDIVPMLPDGYREASMEFEYDVKPSDHGNGPPDRTTMLFCVHCGTKHWRGYVMKSACGSRFLTGKDCGTKIYHLDFSRIEREFRYHQARQYDLNRLVRCLPLLRPTSAALLKLSQDNSYRQLAGAQEGLKKHMTELFQLLNAAAARQDRTLTIFETVRDDEAMRARTARNNEKRKELAEMTVTEKKRLRKWGDLPVLEDESEPIMRRQDKAVMTLHGVTLFKRSAAQLIESIAGQGRVAELMYSSISEKQSHNVDNTTLVEMLRKFEGLVSRVNELQSDLIDMSAFFGSLHLRQIAEWASNTPQAEGDYSSLDHGLVFVPRGGYFENAVIGLPRRFSLPDNSAIRALESELSASTIAAVA